MCIRDSVNPAKTAGELLKLRKSELNGAVFAATGGKLSLIHIWISRFLGSVSELWNCLFAVTVFEGAILIIGIAAMLSVGGVTV